MYVVFKELRFEAAHRLPHVPADHPCARLHGHSYLVRVEVRGELDPKLGWVIDFARITEACAPLVSALDHRELNEVPGLENPTSEHLAAWIWTRLAPWLPGLDRVEVRETATSGCSYRGTPANGVARALPTREADVTPAKPGGTSD